MKPCFSFLMFYPLDNTNIKKLKNQKLTCLVYVNNNRILVKSFQNNVKIKQYNFFRKIPKITILFCVLVFRFMYLVSVYPTNR